MRHLCYVALCYICVRCHYLPLSLSMSKLTSLFFYFPGKWGMQQWATNHDLWVMVHVTLSTEPFCFVCSSFCNDVNLPCLFGDVLSSGLYTRWSPCDIYFLHAREQMNKQSSRLCIIIQIDYCSVRNWVWFPFTLCLCVPSPRAPLYPDSCLPNLINTGSRCS